MYGHRANLLNNNINYHARGQTVKTVIIGHHEGFVSLNSVRLLQLAKMIALGLVLTQLVEN